MKRILWVATAALMFGAAPAVAQSHGGYYGQGGYRAGHVDRGYGGGYAYGQPWNGGAYYSDRGGRRHGYDARDYRHERREIRRHERREHGSRYGYRGW